MGLFPLSFIHACLSAEIIIFSLGFAAIYLCILQLNKSIKWIHFLLV